MITFVMLLKGGDNVEGKFAGVGLKNIIVLWLMFILLTVMAKAILTKHPVKGLSEVVQAV